MSRHRLAVTHFSADCLLGVTMDSDLIESSHARRVLCVVVGLLVLLLASPAWAQLPQSRDRGDTVSTDASGSAPASPVLIDGWRTDTLRESQRGQPTGGSSDDARAMLDDANAAEARGHLEIAQRLLEQIIAKDPGAAEAELARRRLGAIYRREFANPSPERSSPQSAKTAVSSSPLPSLHVPQPSSAIDGGGEGVRPANLDAGGLAPGGGGDAREVSLSTPIAPGATDTLLSPQPWRARARASPRFEQLLRTDVGDRIFFGVGSAEIGTRARSVLESQAEWLARYPDLYVVVEGHSDEPGSEADNDVIARLRALTARKLLVGMGMKADRVDIDVRGRQDPVATCESSECRTQNRRVVIRLMLVLPHQTGDRRALP